MLLLFCLLGVVSASADVRPQNKVVEYGNATELTCCFNGSDVTHEWKFRKWSKDNGLFTIICDKDRPKCKEGFQTNLTENSLQQSCSHLMLNVTQYDSAGLYQCSQSDSGLQYGSYLVVYNFTCGSNASSDEELVEGETLALRCEISWRGKLPFELKWLIAEGIEVKREMFEIPLESYTSFITVNLKRPSVGSFVASLRFSSSDIADENLDRYSPSVNWTFPGQSVLFPVENIRVSCPKEDCHRKVDSLINCSAEGNPRPEFRWKDWDGRVVSNSSVMRVVSTETHEYTCVAKNVIRGVQHEVSQKIVIKIIPDDVDIARSSSVAEKSESSTEAIIGIGVGIVFAVMLVFGVLVVIAVKLNRNDRLTRKQIAMLGLAIAEDRREFLRQISINHEDKKPEEIPLKKEEKDDKEEEEEVPVQNEAISTIEIHECEARTPVQVSAD